jgi:vitamin B12 transporter
MWKQSLLFGVIALTTPFGLAQENDEPELRPDTITVSGLRAVASDDLTASVTVIDAELIAVRSSPYLADQLRQVPGASVSRSGASGGLTQLRIRGAEANHTLFLIDGIEVSDPTTGETDFGLFSGLYPDRVEVLRGEQSGIYGSDAIGGVVNVITGGQQGARGLLEYGSFDTWRLDGAYGFDFETGDLTLAFADVITEGVDTSGTGGETDGSQNYSGLVTGGLELGRGWEARGLLRYGYAEVETDPDLDFDGRLDDADRETESTQWTLGGVLSGDGFGVNHQFRFSYNTVERENFADGASTNSSEGDRTKLAWSPSREFRQGDADITLTGLIDYEIEDYSARDTQFGGLTNQEESFETFGLAGEVRLSNGPLSLSANVRFDGNDDRFEDATTGRIGAAYDLGAGGRVRTSVGTGVKNPTFTELFGFFPGSFIGNPDLVPEQSTSWEIGWDGEIGPLTLSATYFDAELEDEIFTAFNPDFTSTARNREGESERSGLELGLRWQATDALSLSGQASFIESSADDGSDEIRVPSETASLAVDYRPEAWKGGRLGLAFDYVGEQDDFDFGAFPAARVTLDSYVLASATAEWPLTDRLAFTLRGENLFDETVTDVLGFNGPGAGVFVGLKLR